MLIQTGETEDNSPLPRHIAFSVLITGVPCIFSLCSILCFYSSTMDPSNDNDHQLRRTDVDVMDVSPAALSESNLAAEENKENDDVQPEQTPLLTPVSRPQPQLTESDAPPLASVAPQNQQNSSGSPPIDDDNRDTQFTYVLRKYNSIAENRVYSPWHVFGGFKWRLLIFPRGNHTSNRDLSVYLECGGPYTREDVLQQPLSNHSMSPNGKEMAVALPSTSWSRPAKFSLHLVHPSSPVAKAAINSEETLTDPSLIHLDVTESNISSRPQSSARSDMVKETNHIFRPNVSDWGFLEFAPFTTLQSNAYADDDMNVVIMVKIRLHEQPVDSGFTNTAPWDSRKETGLVGFKNQGATCYMNSLLQTLYMLSAFRKAVYNMPLPEPGNEISGSELSYALQKVFYELQFSPSVVKTKKLTESFGWDTTDAFTQHDVQELKLILCDELAEKMKKIAPNQPNRLSTLFQGKLLNYIECVNVPYKSTREEEFSDLSLNVKGCQNIYESFEKYTEVEMMDGDNKYRADGFEELQDARKGVKFLQLPPVLQLHLKRFEYDTTRDAMVKINDRYEFETEIDLSRFVEKSDGKDVYVLHSVLVHIGDVNGGHYHAFIRPEIVTSGGEDKKSSQWYKFDDETVSRATEEAAVHDNFGVGGEKEFAKRGIDDELGNGGLNGQTNPPSVFHNRGRNYQPRRFSNAYMLQYLRKSDVPYLLSPPKEGDVPEELAGRIQREREEEEQRKRDNTEQHLYMTIAVATDVDMIHHHESDLVNWEKVRPLRVKRATQLGELKTLLQNEGTVQDARQMRLWKCTGRQNQTIRPDSLVANGDDSQPIDINGRDPLSGGLNVPLYTGRHGYYGHEDVLRLYAEDLCSKYCLSGGVAHAAFAQSKVRENGEKTKESSLAEKRDVKERLSTEDVVNEYPSWSFPLRTGLETMLFLKYYISKPSPKLQWLGHAVVDRTKTVKEIEPILLHAVELFRQIRDEVPPVKNESNLRIFEEVCAASVKELDPNKTLEHHQIPCDSGNGDIIVFQETLSMPLNKGKSMKEGLGRHGGESSEWNGFQEISRGDGTDLPLGGRPLQHVKMFYDYLAYRVKVEFKDREHAGDGDEGKSIFFELSRKDTYRTARKVLSGALGDDIDPDYIRFFSHDFNRDAPAPEAFRISDDEPLDRLVPLHTMVTTGQAEYRTIWYERTEYHISEFERNEEVRVVWRPDGGTRSTGYVTKSGLTGGNGSLSKNADMKDVSDVLGATDMSIDGEDEKGVENGDVYGDENVRSTREFGLADNVKTFSVLVPISSKFWEVMEQVRAKLEIRPDTEIRMFEVKSSRIMRFIEANENVPPLVTGCHDYGVELRAEPVPSEETLEALGDEYELMPVVHLAKQGRTWRALTLFGQPFVVKVKKDGESVDIIRQRIQEKIGVPSEEFDGWALAEIAQLKVVFLEEGQLYKPRSLMAMEFCSLAIEHKNTAPPKRLSSTASRFTDRPLKIRS